MREKIKEIIDKKGITKYRLSKMSGIEGSTLKRYFDEGADMKISNIEKICNALDLKIILKKKTNESNK